MLVYSFSVVQDQNWRIGQYLVLSIFWNKVYIQEVLLNLCLKYYASFVITCIAFTCMYAIFFLEFILPWHEGAHCSLIISFLFIFKFINIPIYLYKHDKVLVC